MFGAGEIFGGSSFFKIWVIYFLVASERQTPIDQLTEQWYLESMEKRREAPIPYYASIRNLSVCNLLALKVLAGVQYPPLSMTEVRTTKSKAIQKQAIAEAYISQWEDRFPTKIEIQDEETRLVGQIDVMFPNGGSYDAVVFAPMDWGILKEMTDMSYEMRRYLLLCTLSLYDDPTSPFYHNISHAGVTYIPFGGNSDTVGIAPHYEFEWDEFAYAEATHLRAEWLSNLSVENPEENLLHITIANAALCERCPFYESKCSYGKVFVAAELGLDKEMAEKRMLEKMAAAARRAKKKEDKKRHDQIAKTQTSLW